MKKLTLTANEEVIKKARQLARKNKTTVSAMFSRFVLSLARRQDRRSDTIPTGSIAAKMSGIAKLPRGKSEEDIRLEALKEKHGVTK